MLEGQLVPQNTPKYRQQLIQEGRHAEAFQAFKQALQATPDNPGLLYNTGLSAYLSGQFAEATTHWERMKDLVPEDIGVRAKLVQAYEALENHSARDAERAELFALRNQSKGAREKLARYCRDQFHVKDFQIQVFEHFELVGEMAIRYMFYILLPGEHKPSCTLSLGSYAATNEYMQQRGELQPDERLFHLDEYRSSGQHRTWKFFKNEPPYEVVKAAVTDILCQA
jgi:tetratricopeptide (TPR) repeat protein